VKLNVRFIIITFIIVLIISLSSTFIFYSLANKVLTEQQSKTLVNAASDFAFSLQTTLQKADEDFRNLAPLLIKFKNINLDSTEIDFVLTLVNDTLINTSEFKVKSNSYLNIQSSSFRKFIISNPSLTVKYAQLLDGRTIYYGKLIATDLLNRVSEKINADVALIIDGAPVETSNPDRNQTRILSIVHASRELKFKNSFDLYREELHDVDFVSSLYIPKFVLFPAAKVNFIIFDTYKEGVEFRDTLQIVMVLIVLAGSAITFIIILVSTAKLRKQIGLLTQAAEVTQSGNFDQRVKVITKDEIGQLSQTFNRMLDEIVQNKKVEKEYSEFITLINQNPTLKEISDAALFKIIKSTNLSFGLLYIVENKKLRLISSYGLSKNLDSLTNETLLYIDAIEKKEAIEFHFKDNFPEINAGIASIKLKYLMIFPIIYNKETIAILEVASEFEPSKDTNKYFNTIQEQLAIGLINAKSLEQLANLVNELRRLNDEYQKQNYQIVEQNQRLKELHVQLQEKADELEKQKEKAVELSMVKSEFLASMSHELRTPLISILGLTELILKDASLPGKVTDRLAIVDRNGKKLLVLINNILEFSKFESGKIDVKKETFLLSELIEEIYPNIQQLVANKNLRLMIDLPKNKDILLNTDKTKLEQVLLNIIVNATKFTDSGYVKLAVTLDSKSDLVFYVADTGIGITEEDQKNIFQEFKQVDSSTSRKYGGAGLGLAICKKYIQLLNGNIWLESELGKGSKFSFLLPNIILEIIDTRSHKFLSLFNTQIEKNSRHEKPILLVSIFAAARQLIEDYLISYNINVIVTNNCEEAINIINENELQGIIANPLDDYLKLINHLKQSRNSTIPIILSFILEDQKLGWNPGVFDFIIEPFNLEKYSRLISNLNEFKNITVSNVLIIDKISSDSKLESVIQEVDNCCVSRISNIDEFELYFSGSQNKVDLVLINSANLEEIAWDYCYKISQIHILKKIPIIFIIPDHYTRERKERVNKKLIQIALNVKSHPLDILKDLRDRLKIEENENISKAKLIEEQHEPENIATDDMIEKPIRLKPTVLIVDDDNDALFTVGEFIKEMNCDTIFAHNGMECLLMLNHVQPDLILLDIMMPQMDGFETIKRIRSDNRFCKTPVIALTAYAMLENKETIEKTGFDDLITKPINSQHFLTKVSRFIKSKVNAN
jgi:signal transduction histidine kinase/CheY-like chemotaxis protein/HAMP domain-containing protein